MFFSFFFWSVVKSFTSLYSPAGEVKKIPCSVESNECSLLIYSTRRSKCFTLPLKLLCWILFLLVRSTVQIREDKGSMYIFVPHSYTLCPLSPAGSLGWRKKRALWLETACWAHSKTHPQSFRGEELGKERLGRTRGVFETAISDLVWC